MQYISNQQSGEANEIQCKMHKSKRFMLPQFTYEAEVWSLLFLQG